MLLGERVDFGRGLDRVESVISSVTLTLRPPVTVKAWPKARLSNRRVQCSKLSSAAAATRPNGVGRSGLPGMSRSDKAEDAMSRIGSILSRCRSWN